MPVTSLAGKQMQPAKFRGSPFYVEAIGLSGGRRLAPHEYPKRDLPYVEDMGRKMRVFPLTAYCVGVDWKQMRDDLILALDQEGVGTLVHPTAGEISVKVGPWAEREVREKGLYAEIEVTFLEAGIEAAFNIASSTQSQVATSADAAQAAITASGNSIMDSLKDV